MTPKKFFHPDQLTAIRERCDWQKLLDDLGVRADVKRCTATEFWGFSPFNPNEKTASFHMKEPGIWYDWSSHATAPGRTRPGGGVIERVQAKRVILSHIGRAATPDQEAKGKWRYYRGFNPSLELYNLDNLLLDKSIETDTVILVEGAFDVAKCVEAGLKNVVATFGARLSDAQADKLAELANAKILVFYDRDQAGQKASTDALAKLAELNIQASSFDWEQQLNSRKERHKSIAETIQDPCDFSVAQLRWLREQGLL